jgi:hypothetical protein
MLLPNDPEVVQAYEQILDSSQVDNGCSFIFLNVIMGNDVLLVFRCQTSCQWVQFCRDC